MHSSESVHNLPPFPAYPSIERYIGLGSVQDAVERIERSIQARDAISVVIGPPGTGKTLISEVIAARYRTSHQVITLGETPLPDTNSFLRRVLHQLGADIKNVPDGDFQLALFDHLCLGNESEPRMLLLIDEAQSLSPELLETIRTLTNLTRNGEPRVSVVLFGGNHVDELLIAPSMDGFRQRISTRCYLHPLNGEETAWYINQTIRNCGCDPDATITAEAISAVHHACSGLPRLINQLLTHAIEFAADKDEHLMTDGIIDQAWAEVQQLPSPMVDEPEINLTETTVEFGELDSFDSPSSNLDTTADHEATHEFAPNNSLTESNENSWNDDPANNEPEYGDKAQDGVGSAETSEFETSEFETSEFETSEFETGEFETGEFETGEFETGDTRSRQEIEQSSTHTPANIATSETDDYDAYDFEPNDNFELDGNYDPSTPINAHVESDANSDFWRESDDTASHAGNLDATPNDDEHRISEDKNSALNYPQLASPALELEAEQEHPSETSSSESFEADEKTQTDQELFGSFAEEEEINLRHDPSNNSTADHSTADHSTADHSTAGPIESALHREILEISEMITSHSPGEIQYCDEAHQLPNKMHEDLMGTNTEAMQIEDSEEPYDESLVENETGEINSTDETPTTLDGSSDTPSHREPQLTGDDELLAEDQDIQIQPRLDDSDLLIIEDEVDLHRIDAPSTSPERLQKSINYKKMLTRMKSKS
ncbi:AAA family ATPase [Rhodopirellula sp.]|nr:AAA family ATPase [Rhodopirellula sp.]